jgi:hypothetical protein
MDSHGGNKSEGAGSVGRRCRLQGVMKYIFNPFGFRFQSFKTPTSLQTLCTRAFEGGRGRCFFESREIFTQSADNGLFSFVVDGLDKTVG